MSSKIKHRSLSLFTGAGGLDIGLEKAGFDVSLCVEVDPDCRATLSYNKPHWKQSDPGDISKISPEEILSQAGIQKEKQVDLLAGGPPCQPFSKSGYWVNGDSKRLSDPRASTLKSFLSVVEVALPKVILLENVKGLVFQSKDEGLKFLIKSLKKINKQFSVNYNLQVIHINCADYGVPQFRERVFLVADRDGTSLSAFSPRYGEIGQNCSSELRPYRTAWDAIGDLDDDLITELAPRGKWADLLPSIPEGKNYLWHTPKSKGTPLFGWRTRYWSFLLKLAKNKPSWTIQAAPGPATGPFHWKNRRLSIREPCRLQTFPDAYEIVGDY
ncbi:MAG: DNA cytosine methyltransferase, partial [Bdellovibrionales bacterium]|nr:DNA cytosine methyltransferase [Bdellovibrionales bacterium]